MTTEELKEKIKKDNPYFKNFDIKDYQVWDFVRFNEEYVNCKSCTGIENCKNSKKGFKPIIDSDNNISYVRCKYMNNVIEQKKRNDRIDAMYMPKSVLEARLEKFDLDNDSRINCMRFIRDFRKNLKENNYAKGAYLHGDVGSGKTYVLSALANELADDGHDVSFVYFPDLINDLKSDFDKVQEIIDKLKKTEILIIDDFGVGTMNGWVRDSILAPILNYRMSDLKPLFISSNISMDELDDYLIVKDDRDDIPAFRIVRRIKELCDNLEVKKRNSK